MSFNEVLPCRLPVTCMVICLILAGVSCRTVLLAIPCSQFSVPCSLFSVLSSLFSVLSSLFSLPHPLHRLARTQPVKGPMRRQILERAPQMHHRRGMHLRD